MVGGQIKGTGATWDRDAVANAGQEVILTNQLVDLGAQIIQVLKTRLNSCEHVH